MPVSDFTPFPDDPETGYAVTEFPELRTLPARRHAVTELEDCIPANPKSASASMGHCGHWACCIHSRI